MPQRKHPRDNDDLELLSSDTENQLLDDVLEDQLADNLEQGPWRRTKPTSNEGKPFSDVQSEPARPKRIHVPPNPNAENGNRNPDMAGLPTMTVQCAAVKRDGTRCTNRAEFGGTCCLWHGGGTAVSRTMAKKRLHACVAPALTVLCEAMQSADWPTAIKAAQIILDRSGFGPTAKLDVTESKSSDDLERLNDEQLARRAQLLANMLTERQRVQQLTQAAGIIDVDAEPTDETPNEETHH